MSSCYEDFIKDRLHLTGMEFIKSIPSGIEYCIDWPFGMKGNYGAVWVDGRQSGAHRESLKYHVGPPEHGSKSYALHKPIACHNPACVNPNHLYWGDAKSNALDKALDGTDCLGFGNPNAKLSFEQVLYVKSSPLSYSKIAEELGVSKSCISYIKSGRRYQDVK